jgi:hypothetical protein
MMSDNINLQNLYEYGDGQWLIADGFNDAILGVHNEKVVYSSNKCIEILKKGGMSEDEAIEYFEYNVLGSYVGDKTPIFVDDLFLL